MINVSLGQRLGIIYLRKVEIRLQHRRRINTEEKAKVVAAGWGTYLNAALTKDGEHPFW